jgi:hypothetical protein
VKQPSSPPLVPFVDGDEFRNVRKDCLQDKSCQSDGMASKGLLHHTNLATTTRHYVKDVPENTLLAMELLEKLLQRMCNRGYCEAKLSV